MVAARIEDALDRAAADRLRPGRRPAAHRLNRVEYVNAVRDLVGVELDAASLLPPDDSGYGFDNIADVLSVSPMLMERYLSAALKISRLAVGNPDIRPATDAFPVSKYLKQDDRVSDDLPFGTRGGVAVRYYFPVDADYVVKIFFDRTYDGRLRGFSEPHQLDVRLDGVRVAAVTVGDPPPSGTGRGAARSSRINDLDGMEIRFPAPAGPGVLGISFVKKAGAPEGMLRPRYPVTSYEYAGDVNLAPGIGSVEIRGPYDIRGPGESPSRRMIFTCVPAAGDVAAEARCARTIITGLARRAYRRPVTDADLAPLLAFYASARQQGTFDEGIEAAIRRILVSPDFLFRVETLPAGAAPGQAYAVSDVELASRLSFFLWSSLPDEPLLDAAARGELRATLEAQVRRMLADPRSSALVDNFAGQWLWIRNLRLLQPDPTAFPDFDENLRHAFEREIRLFVDSQVREDRGVPDLLTADYTFLNERLARHYGIPGVYGSHFRRVALADVARHGLLGKGSILMATSYPNRTSPVLRGKWLLENVLGAPPPPPPPDVPALAEPEAASPRTMRGRMEQHRANPACAACHKVMDPLGFALENFDAIGRWRTDEAGQPIDASGTLADGSAVAGPETLAAAFLARREEFVNTVIAKLLTYALGRGVEYYDAPAVRQVVRRAAPGGYRWSDLIVGITESVPFQMREAGISASEP
jgi:hypothetical protein